MVSNYVGMGPICSLCMVGLPPTRFVCVYEVSC